MNRLKYNLLRRLQTGQLSMAEVYSNPKIINKTRSAVKELLRCGLVSQNPVSRSFSITAEGLLALEHESHRKSQRRHDYLVATYGIIGGIISGAVSSLIVLKLQGLL